MAGKHPQHLWQAPGGTWYLNVAVPKKYREAVGRDTYMRSLRTKDRDEAKRLKHAAMVEAQAHFERCLSGRPITPDEIEHAKAQAVYDAFQTRNPADLEVFGDIAVAEGQFADYHEKRAHEIIGDIGAGETPETVHRLALALANADREAWARYQKGWKPLPPDRAVRRGAGDGLTIGAAVEAYFKDATKRGKWTGKTRQLYRACADRFAAHVGTGRSLAGIAKSDAVAYLDGLPAEHATATRNRHVMALRGLFEWAMERGDHGGPNPFDRLSHAQDKRERQRSHWLPLTTAELQMIVEQPAIRPKRHTWATARQWIVWVMLYSGLRPDEICELAKSDIRSERGVTFFDIIAAKSAAGVRQVPVHEKLAELGFLEYVAALTRGSAMARPVAAWVRQTPRRHSVQAFPEMEARQGSDAAEDCAV